MGYRMELSRIASEMFDALEFYLDSAADPPTIIVGDVFTFAGPMIAESRDLPLIVNSPVLLGGVTNPLAFISIADMNFGKGTPSHCTFV